MLSTILFNVEGLKTKASKSYKKKLYMESIQLYYEVRCFMKYFFF